MTIKDMKDLLEAVPGFAGKVTYYQWPIKAAPELPFVCYFSETESTFAADNINYYSRPEFRVELYTKTRDLALEALFEAAFTAAGLYYTKESAYLDDEHVFMALFVL